MVLNPMLSAVRRSPGLDGAQSGARVLPTLFAIAGTLAAMGVYSFVLGNAEDPLSAGADERGVWILFAIIYAGTLTYLAPLLYRRILPPPIFVFGGVCMAFTLSALGSHAPSTVIIYSSMCMLNLCFGWWLAQAFTDDQTARILLIALSLCFAFTAVAAWRDFDSIVYHDPLDRNNYFGFVNIKGVFPHKIHAGLFNALGAVICYALWSAQKRRMYAAGMLMFSILSISAGSSLAVACLIMTIPAFFVLRALFTRTNMVIVLICLSAMCSIAILVVFLGVPQNLLEMAGRDTTLTGRTNLWAAGLQYFMEHPILGVGFRTFFDGDPNSPGAELWRNSSYYFAPSFHQGYLELAVETGLIGFVAGVGLLFSASRSAFRDTFDATSPNWIGPAITMLVLLNTAASFLYKPNSLWTILIGYAFCRRYARVSRRVQD